MIRKGHRFAACIAAIVSCLLPQDAFAYLDLGAGSYIFQLLIAGLVGGLYTLKIHWRRIVLFFRNLLRRNR